MIAGLRRFGLEAETSTIVLLSAGLMFLLGCAELTAANVAQTLFVKRVGTAALALRPDRVAAHVTVGNVDADFDAAARTLRERLHLGWRAFYRSRSCGQQVINNRR